MISRALFLSTMGSIDCWNSLNPLTFMLQAKLVRRIPIFMLNRHCYHLTVVRAQVFSGIADVLLKLEPHIGALHLSILSSVLHRVV